TAKDAQAVAQSAKEAATRAAQAAAAARTAFGQQAAGTNLTASPDGASAIAAATADAARAADDAAAEAARAADEANQAASNSSAAARETAARAAKIAHDAAERAQEAGGEGGDPPATVSPAAPVRPSTGDDGHGSSPPMDATAALARGKALFQAQDYAAARDRLREAVGLDPEQDEARALLAWADYQLGDFRGAVVAFQSALRRQPTWEGLADGLGWTRPRLGGASLALAAVPWAPV